MAEAAAPAEVDVHQKSKSLWKRAGIKVKMTNIAAHAFESVPHGIDSSTFFSPSIPPEVRAAVPAMYRFDQPQFRRILEACVACLKGVDFDDSQFEALQTELGVGGPACGLVFTGVYTIIRMAVRNHTRADVILRDLKEMKLPESFAQDITRTIKLSRIELEQSALVNRVRFPALEDLQWRVDISISSSSLARVMRPTILLHMTLSDGRLRTVEVPVEQFHQLRYNTAKVLRDMKNLESHPIMRLAFDADKERFDKAHNK